MGKLSQAIAHDAELLQVQGNFDDCLDIARDLAEELPGAPRQLGQPRPHRGPEDRRVRGRRGARRRPRLPLRPGRQRRQLHRLPPRLQRGARSAAQPRSCRACSASRPRAAPRSCSARSSSTPRPSPARSASATPPRGSSPSTARERQRRLLRRDQRRRRSSRPTASSRPRSASSSSPPPPSASPDCSSAPRRARSPRAPRVVLTVTGHGLKDPQWALRTADGVGRHADGRARRHRGDRRRARAGAARMTVVEPDACSSAAACSSGCRRPSANLGPGFDTLGLALSLYDELRSPRRRARRDGRRCTASARARCRPTRRTSSCAPSPHLRRLRQPMPGLDLVARNVIPHGRGLGSSGAAIVSGIMAAKGLLEGIVEIDADGLLALATEMEGHPDNVAPALFGGLTIAWVTPEGPRAQEAHGAPRRLAARVRARAHHVDGARAQPAARVGAARGRHLQRVALGAARSRRSSRAPSCCSRRPRTGCTRTTAPRRCPRPTCSSRCCASTASRPSSPAPDRRSSCWAATPRSASPPPIWWRSTPRPPGHCSCWPSTSRVLQ